MTLGSLRCYGFVVFRGPGYPITGMGLANSLGLTVPAVANRLFQGPSGLAAVTFADEMAAPYTGVVGALEKGVLNGHSLRQSRQAGLSRLGFRSLAECVRSACLRWRNHRVGLVLGTSTGGIAASERAFFAFRAARAIPDDYSFEKQHAFNGIADMLAAEFELAGPCYVVSTACSSSAKALAAAGRLLATGVCDAVVVGGVDSLCLTTLHGFNSLSVVSERGCRPFAVDRDGISLGEGAAFVLLEREGDAAAFVVSAGETGDAYHMAHPHPEGRGAEHAMRQALQFAGIDPIAVDYVNAHGTGTTLNDSIEAAAIGRVFARAPRPLVSSTKWLTGHQLGASGVTEAVFSANAITAQTIPGNGPIAADPALGLSIPERAVPARVDFVLSNSLAFGGSNASVLIASERGKRACSNAVMGAAEHALRAELVLALAWGDPSGTGGAVVGQKGERPQQLLSARARGRASALTLIFAELLEGLASDGFDVARSPVIFGSAYGEMATTMRLLELLVDAGQSSPLRFQHSVHNTAAGVLSIATGNSGFSTSVAAGTDTCSMALLEAIVYLQHSGASEVGVAVADEASSMPLSSKQHGPVGAAFWLKRLEAGSTGWVLSLPQRKRCERSPEPEHPGIADNPSVDALRLVRAFRAGRSGSIALGSCRVPSECWAVELARGTA